MGVCKALTLKRGGVCCCLMLGAYKNLAPMYIFGAKLGVCGGHLLRSGCLFGTVRYMPCLAACFCTH